MNSIQNTACLIAAYETAAGLPDRDTMSPVSTACPTRTSSWELWA